MSEKRVCSIWFQGVLCACLLVVLGVTGTEQVSARGTWNAFQFTEPTQSFTYALTLEGDGVVYTAELTAYNE